jgi:hypothetical protein
MFHWVTGIPFERGVHAGAYDDLTLWEQIDDGAQHTPAKKWLFSVPIVLYVLSATIFLTPSDALQFPRLDSLHQL